MEPFNNLKDEQYSKPRHHLTLTCNTDHIFRNATIQDIKK